MFPLLIEERGADDRAPFFISEFQSLFRFIVSVIQYSQHVVPVFRQDGSGNEMVSVQPSALHSGYIIAKSNADIAAINSLIFSARNGGRRLIADKAL